MWFLQIIISNGQVLRKCKEAIWRQTAYLMAHSKRQRKKAWGGKRDTGEGWWGWLRTQQGPEKQDLSGFLHRVENATLWGCLAVNWKRRTQKTRSERIWDQDVTVSSYLGGNPGQCDVGEGQGENHFKEKHHESSYHHWHKSLTSLRDSMSRRELFSGRENSWRSFSPSPAWDLWERRGNEAVRYQVISQAKKHRYWKLEPSLLHWEDNSRTMAVPDSMTNLYMC